MSEEHFKDYPMTEPETRFRCYYCGKKLREINLNDRKSRLFKCIVTTCRLREIFVVID